MENKQENQQNEQGKFEKAYVGIAWEHQVEGKEPFYSISLNEGAKQGDALKVSDLKADEKGLVRVSISILKEPDAKTRATHTVYRSFQGDKYSEIDLLLDKSKAVDLKDQNNNIQLLASKWSAELKEAKNLKTDYSVQFNSRFSENLPEATKAKLAADKTVGYAGFGYQADHSKDSSKSSERAVSADVQKEKKTELSK